MPDLVDPAKRKPVRIIGVDGCPSGWIGVARDFQTGANAAIIMVSHFSDIIDHADRFTIIAVDMPIGLPDRIEGPGRGPEQAVRPMLGARQSSVFSIPARAAVEEPDYRKACDMALSISTPPRKISKQAFNIFPKILEIDRLMTPSLEERVYEVHPELAFWRLNGERPVATPKKVKSRVNPEGIAERIQLLSKNGFDLAFLEQKPPKGAAFDDFIDACVCCVMAERALSGDLQSFPANYARDGKGLRIAIWA